MAGGPERQHLPQALARGRQKVGKLVGGRTEIANTTARREGCRVQQDTGGAGE